MKMLLLKLLADLGELVAAAPLVDELLFDTMSFDLTVAVDVLNGGAEQLPSDVLPGDNRFLEAGDADMLIHDSGGLASC